MQDAANIHDQFGAKTLIEMVDLSKRLSLHGDEVVTLREVSAKIHEGEFITVVGPSGRAIDDVEWGLTRNVRFSIEGVR